MPNLGKNLPKWRVFSTLHRKRAGGGGVGTFDSSEESKVADLTQNCAILAWPVFLSPPRAGVRGWRAVGGLFEGKRV